MNGSIPVQLLSVIENWFQRYDWCPPYFIRSRDPTTHLSGMVCHPKAGRPILVTMYLPTKFEVPISIHYEDMKGDTKCRKWGGLW